MASASLFMVTAAPCSGRGRVFYIAAPDITKAVERATVVMSDAGKYTLHHQDGTITAEDWKFQIEKVEDLGDVDLGAVL